MNLCWSGQENYECYDENGPSDLVKHLLTLLEDMEISFEEIGSVLLYTGLIDTVITAKYYHQIHGESWFDPSKLDISKLTRTTENPEDLAVYAPESIAIKTLFEFATGHKYSDALSHPDFNAYNIFNTAMPQIISCLDSISTKWSDVLDIPLVTYRGISVQTRGLSQCMPRIGDTYITDNYVSTSLSCHIAGAFIRKSIKKSKSAGKCAIVYKYMIPPYTKCIPTFGMHYYPEECEVILVPGLQWTIIDVEYSELDQVPYLLVTLGNLDPS